VCGADGSGSMGPTAAADAHLDGHVELDAANDMDVDGDGLDNAEAEAEVEDGGCPLASLRPRPLVPSRPHALSSCLPPSLLSERRTQARKHAA
jgi:hypothetical protein